MPNGYADDGSDMWTPPDWQRPSWWTDEMDDLHPLARFQITTKRKASEALSRRRYGRSHTAERRAEQRARRSKHEAPKKVAEFQRKVAELEAREARLAAIVARQTCHGESKDDGTPYEAFFDVERDLASIRERKLRPARKALWNWIARTHPGNPQGPPEVPHSV